MSRYKLPLLPGQNLVIQMTKPTKPTHLRVVKPTAADRTINMFSKATPIEERPIEVLPDDEKLDDRVPVEQDVDRRREAAFTGQEWTTKFFGVPEAEGNQYRMSKRGEFYYLEMLHKLDGVRTAHGYTGVMVHERDLFSMATVIVAAVRAKQHEDSQKPSTG